MTRHFIFYILIFSPLISLCQKPIVEAIYYDNQNKPYRIERKYFSPTDSSALYVRITDDNIVSIRQKTFHHKDTTVFQEEYSSIKKRKTKADILSESIMLITTGGIGDTTISTYHLYNDSTIIDTIYPGKQSLLSSVTPKENDIVSKVLNNRFKFSLDSLTIDETVKTYSVKGQIIKCETIDPDNLPYYTVSFTKEKNGLTSKSIFIYSKKLYPDKNTIPNLTRLDTVSWNKDKSQIFWTINSIEHGRFLTKYFLNGATLQIFETDTLYKEVIYLENPDIFKIILMDNITYDDKLYSIDLLVFDREKILKTFFPKGQTIINEYKTDNQKRIIEQRQLRNEKLFKRVAYSYGGQ